MALQNCGGGGAAVGADDERLAGEAAVEDRLLRGPDAVALRLPHPRGRHPQRGGPPQSKCSLSSTFLGMTVLLGKRLT